MASNFIPIGLSDSHSLVWAMEASASQTYTCARCGVILQLDQFENEFRHPSSTICSAWHSVRRLAVLVLQYLLEQGERDVVLCQVCPRCKQTHERIVGAGSASCLVSTDEPNDGILIDTDYRLLIAMRPMSNTIPKLSEQLGSVWVEVDARNVLSGTPILVLEGNLQQHACSFDGTPVNECHKLSNPYSHIG